MFATLLGSLPRPPLSVDAEPDAVLSAVVGVQEAAGLEPISDAGFAIGGTAVARWRTTSAMTDRPVKATLLGPYSTARGAVKEAGVVFDDATLTAAETIRSDVVALAAAGCSYIEIHEPGAIEIGADEPGQALFREAHWLLLDGVDGPHLSLAITGGNADTAGVETLLAAPYASLAVDLIAGPDNWRLVSKVPGERGIVCGALSASRDSDDRPEVLLWAAGYASSTGGRGRDRVGLGTASSLSHLPWEVAMRKVRVLGEAARLADMPPDERRVQLDPRAVDIRSAALGRVVARERWPRRRRP